MTKRIILSWMLLLLSITSFAAITVTSPSSNETVTAAEDFATAAFQDPWDMDKRTDLGWFIYDVVSGSKSNLSNISFSNGIFSASSTSSDPNISILETGIKGTCLLGKIGTNYKIDASKYKYFVVRMKLNKKHDAMLFWSKDTIYDDYSYSGIFSVYDEWAIYIINIPALGYTKVPGYTKGYAWTGTLSSLRFDPAPVAVNINIDWIRLVESNSSLFRTVKWTGNSGNVDIYLDDDRTSSNGTLGLVAKNVSGTSYSLYVGALASGKYYVGVKNTSGGGLSYSTAYYQVNDIPYLQFTAPSKEGGSDFAQMVLNNAWDMNTTSDLDSYANLASAPAITTVAGETQEGDSLGSLPVLIGTNKTGSMDPITYPLWFDGGRGATNYIDSSKYRILVLKMGLPGNWDLVHGSVARIYWHVRGEFSGNVELMHQSADVVLRHKSGNVVMNTIIADMKYLTLESSQSTTGWNGLIDGFRVDPHEFTSSKNFYIDEIKLAAFEKADSSYTIKWDYVDSLYTSPTLSLYRDGNNSGYNGTLIKSGLNPSAGSYTWNTSNMSAGTYYIYATVTDGRNTNRVYAPWPIVIDHSADPTAKIDLSRSRMDFGAVGGTTTNPQTFMIENTGTGTMNWNVSSSASWLNCSPSSGSGSGVVSVSVSSAGLAKGTYTGTVSVTSANATNSPQTVSVTLKVYGSGTTDRPFGDFLTPASGSNVSSSIAVTGWVLDDVGLEAVKIYNGDSYVGTAVFVEGARADIEAAYPGYPQNYQAGWGYMLLTNFLPNGGNGTYTLVAKAVDKEGKWTTLDSKTIHVDNANAVKPFGAIDTPTQGGTASGSSFTNAGWVLTPQPNKILENGSKINVYVDGVLLGHPTYDQYRSDIASLFPGYANSDGALASYKFDTTNYANGIHTIEWNATDTGGNIDGIGSRFFVVQNIGTNDAATTAGETVQPSVIRTRRMPENWSKLQSELTMDDTPVKIRRGFAAQDEAVECYPGDNGKITLEIYELERVEIKLDKGYTAGYSLTGNRPRPLPVGSTLDAEKGVFYWSPGPGFVGDYDLTFVNEENGLQRAVTIQIVPKER